MCTSLPKICFKILNNHIKMIQFDLIVITLYKQSLENK